MEFEEEVYGVEALSELHSLPISLEKLLLCTSRNEERNKNIIYYLQRRVGEQNNPPALENNLPVCTDRCCLGKVRPLEPWCHSFTCGSSISASLCWSRCVKAVLEDFLHAELQQNSSLKLQRAALGSSLAVWFQDVPELTGTSLLTCHKSRVKPTIARVSSALFPHRKARSGNEGNCLSLPFSPPGLISQHCCW